MYTQSYSLGKMFDDEPVENYSIGIAVLKPDEDDYIKEEDNKNGFFYYEELGKRSKFFSSLTELKKHYIEESYVRTGEYPILRWAF